MDRYYDNEILSDRYDPSEWIGIPAEENYEGMYRRINSLEPELVIDAGCGRNQHKNKIKNLIGFDPSPFPEIDFRSTIIDAKFEKNSADALLLLGSVQHIDEEYVRENMDKAISWCKPQAIIEMRVRPFENNPAAANPLYHENLHFYWPFRLVTDLMKIYNLSFLEPPITYDFNNRGLRSRWTWIKN